MAESKSERALEPYQIEQMEVHLKWKGKKQKLIVLRRHTKSVLALQERDTEYKKNPTLRKICNIGNSVLYYNMEKDEFWFMTNKKNSHEVVWNKVEDHDMDAMYCVGLLNLFKFESSEIPIRMRVKGRLKDKIRVFNDRFHGKKPRKRR